jgi:hypothetical protein
MDKLDPPTEKALNDIQDTELTPLEEALFQSWAAANQIEKPDRADDPTDYRGIYKATNAKVLPFGQLKQITKKINAEEMLKRVLAQRGDERGW